MAAPVLEWKETNNRFMLWMNNVPTDYLQWSEGEAMYVTRKRQPVAHSLEDAKAALIKHYVDYHQNCAKHKQRVLDMNRPPPHAPKAAKSVVSETSLPDSFFDDLSEYFL